MIREKEALTEIDSRLGDGEINASKIGLSPCFALPFADIVSAIIFGKLIACSSVISSHPFVSFAMDIILKLIRVPSVEGAARLERFYV